LVISLLIIVTSPAYGSLLNADFEENIIAAVPSSLSPGPGECRVSGYRYSFVESKLGIHKSKLLVLRDDRDDRDDHYLSAKFYTGNIETDDLVFEWDAIVFNAKGTDNGFVYYVYAVDSSGHVVWDLISILDSAPCYAARNPNVIVPNSLQHFKVYVNFSQKTFDVSIDGKVVICNRSFNNSDATNFKYLAVDTLSESTATIGIDNLNIDIVENDDDDQFNHPFNDYPFTYDDCPNCRTNLKGDNKWGFYINNCTSYVAHRLNNDLGDGQFENYKDNDYNNRWGDGGNWNKHVDNVEGFEIVSTPQAGDVAEWTTWGHVAYVEAVTCDGGIIVSEYNWTGEGCRYGLRFLTKESNYWPNFFIRATLAPAVTVDYTGYNDGEELNEATTLAKNVELTPYGIVYIKTWYYDMGIVLGTFGGTENTESTVKATRYAAQTSGASSATFLFSTPVTKVISYIANFDGNTTFVAYNNETVLKTINITSSTPKYYSISDVGSITKVVVTSTSAWLGPLTSLETFLADIVPPLKILGGIKCEKFSSEEDINGDGRIGIEEALLRVQEVSEQRE